MRKANEAVADIYDDAAQFLEDQGWCTDCSENRFSQHCVLIALLSTAIRHAVATGGVFQETLRTMRLAEERYAPGEEGIVGWYDPRKRPSVKRSRLRILRHTARVYRKGKVDLSCGTLNEWCLDLVDTIKDLLEEDLLEELRRAKDLLEEYSE